MAASVDTATEESALLVRDNFLHLLKRLTDCFFTAGYLQKRNLAGV